MHVRLYMGSMRRFIPFLKSPPLIPVVRLSGMIAASGRFGAQVLSDQAVAPLLERAFRRSKPAAVALVVNSPGGSPVQSALIAGRIRRLAEERGLHVHAFVEDVAASGGYYIASAADSIWLDSASITGSIGVISAGFGFPELIARYGVERRVYTAGRSKGMLDPFLPEKEEDVTRLRALQDRVHASFSAHGRARRGDRLDASADLFTGEVWVGQEAVALGLADGIAHLVPKMKELYGPDVRLAEYGPRRSLLPRLGPTLAGAVFGVAEERALWARYGL